MANRPSVKFTQQLRERKEFCILMYVLVRDKVDCIMQSALSFFVINLSSLMIYSIISLRGNYLQLQKRQKKEGEAMKKLLVVMLSLCMVIELTACGGDGSGNDSSDTPTQLVTTDEFISNLKKGLEERWEVAESQDEEEYTESESTYVDYFTSCE